MSETKYFFCTSEHALPLHSNYIPIGKVLITLNQLPSDITDNSHDSNDIGI